MKKTLPASRILENISQLKGYSTKRELAEFFGVGPSSITDWVNRKGDLIPARRLAEASRRHGLRWQWLAYGEAPPYEEQPVEVRTGVELDPAQLELLRRIKESPAFRRAVDRLIGLEEEQVRLVTRLAESMRPAPIPMPREDHALSASDTCAEELPYREWRSHSSLTKSR